MSSFLVFYDDIYFRACFRHFLGIFVTNHKQDYIIHYIITLYLAISKRYFKMVANFIMVDFVLQSTWQKNLQGWATFLAKTGSIFKVKNTPFQALWMSPIYTHFFHTGGFGAPAGPQRPQKPPSGGCPGLEWLPCAGAMLIFSVSFQF